MSAFSLYVYQGEKLLQAVPAESLAELASWLTRLLAPCRWAGISMKVEPEEIRIKDYPEKTGLWGRPFLIGPGLVRFQAGSAPRDGRLSMEALLAYAERLRRERYLDRRLALWPGEGPVPRTGRHQNPSKSRAFRRPQSQQARRQACPVDREEPCSRRKVWEIPTARCDIYRRLERNWKAQHRGRKAWDRG